MCSGYVDDPTQPDFGIDTGQPRRSWEELLAHWTWADESGWDSAWCCDHFLPPTDGDNSGPCLDGLTILAAMAMATKRIRMGLMVTSMTHRQPTVLAKQNVTIDVISSGRMLFGAGAGWNAREHQALGIDFPSPRDRVDRFGEAMEIIRRSESEERVTFNGAHYQVADCPFEPRPVNGHIPVLVGSTGKRMMQHIARYADAWDGGGTPEEYAATGARLNAICTEIGRDPSEIRWALSTGAEHLESPEAFETQVRRYWDVGVRSFLFSTPRGDVTDAMKQIAAETMPRLREELRA